MTDTINFEVAYLSLLEKHNNMMDRFHASGKKWRDANKGEYNEIRRVKSNEYYNKHKDDPIFQERKRQLTRECYARKMEKKIQKSLLDPISLGITI